MIPVSKIVAAVAVKWTPRSRQSLEVPLSNFPGSTLPWLIVMGPYVIPGGRVLTGALARGPQLEDPAASSVRPAV